MIIRASSKFIRSYKKLPKRIQETAREKERIFRNNPFDHKLGTHKLHGKYKNYWSFTIEGQYRIMFTFLESGDVDFINVGTHEIYK